MKKLLSFALAALLLCSCALAQTPIDERSALSAWSAGVYETAVWQQVWEDESASHPFAFEEIYHPDLHLNEWTFAACDGETSMRGAQWLPQQGVAAEAFVDLDGDGAGEWIVVTTREGEGFRAQLWLSVYEASAGSVTLADEICLNAAEIDTCGEQIELFLMDKDGRPALFLAGSYSVDSIWHENWVLSYQDGSLQADSCLFAAQDGEGAWYIHTAGARDAAAVHQFSPWDLPGDAKTHRFSFENSATFAYQYGLSAEAMGVSASQDGAFFLFGYEPLEGGKTTLFRLDTHAETESGEPAFRVLRKTMGYSVVTIGSVNLRNEPSLNGTAIEILEEGESMQFLGESSTDERGVVWYLVRTEENDGWISSKFTLFE